MGTNPILRRIRWIAAGVLVTAAGAVGGISAQLAADAAQSAQVPAENSAPVPVAPDRTAAVVRGELPAIPGGEVAVAGWSPTAPLWAADTDSDTDTSGS
ncbi:hypothetical protein NONO_c40930 [Nocardia nova SH22a]|uniref:Uncharacterized protein n=1 Tax=Nocardia nova SH22a TaxID=1415166 RepID=W5TI27_9NOCA|nr:hypothetical protein [Nocardia nova]AHH18877.1 hypothetical protein NONO_c40930 [Nocardia nova SH22a]